MITLHESNITSFPLDNGIGVLSDAIKAYAEEEELNGMFEFYMEYDSEGHLVDELKEERIIKAKAQDKLGYQLFRIYSITKNHDNDNLIINAQHVTYDLGNNFVEKMEANRLTKKQVMEKIGTSTAEPHPFNVTSSNTTTQSSTSLYRTNPLQMIAGMEGSVLQIWGGQIERDNFNLILHDRRGHDDGVLVTYEKNLTGLTATFDISGLVTRIFPFVFIDATDDEPERLITVDGKYIDSPLINNYEQVFIRPIDYSNDDRVDTQDKTDAQIRTQLTNVANRYFNETNNDKVKSEMEVQFAHLWETEEYKDVAPLELVGMGDTVTINHSKLKVYATAIVNYIKYDCIAQVNEEVKLGSVKARLTDSINKIDNIERKVEQAENNANQAIISSNGKNTTFYGPDEPTEGMQKGDLWFKVIDGQYNRTYRFDGTEWRRILDMDSHEAKEQAQQAKDDAQSAVDRADSATQTANNAITQAQAGFDLAQDALGTASNAIIQADDAFSRANEAFTEVESLSTMVDDNTGEISTIKQSVAGLQTQVSDNEGNISNLTQIATGLQTRVSDAEGNISTLTQTSTQFNQRIGKIEDWEIGGTNLNKDSNNFSRSVLSSYDGSVLRVTENVTVEEWGATDATQVRAHEGNGTSILKVLKNINNDTNTVLGETYTVSFYVKNLRDIPMSVNVNGILPRPTVNLEANEAKRVVVTGERGTANLQLQFRSFGTGYYTEFIVWRAQVEEGNKVMSWSPAPEDIQHEFSAINQTIDTIATRVQNAEGDITTVTQIAQGLQTQVTDIDGNVNTLTQLSTVMQSRLTDAEGNISTLTQTSESLVSRIGNLANPNLITHDPDEWGDARGTKFIAEGVALKDNTDYTLTDYSTQLVDGLQVNVGGSPLPANVGGVFRFNSSDFVNTNLFIRSSDPDFFERLGTVYKFKLEEGTESTAWTMHDEDTYSQYSQLNNAINLRVQKGDVINQINLDTSGAYIGGKAIILDGDTTVTGQFKVGNANITSLDAGKVTVGELVGHSLVGGSVIGGYIEQQSGSRRLELYNGIIDSFYNGQLAMRFGQYSLEFYNKADDSIGRIIPVTSLSDPNRRGLGFIVDNDILNIGFRKSGAYRPILRTDFVDNVTDISGPYNNLNSGSSLRLFGNRRAVSEGRFSAFDQPALALDQGDDTNNLRFYFGGFGRRSGASTTFRWRESDSSFITVLDIRQDGLRVRGDYLRIGNNNSGDPVFRAGAIRNRTSTSDANVRINPDSSSGGLMYRTTSSEKQKINIKSINYEHALKVLDLTPSTWYDKNDCETYAEHLTCGDRSLLSEIEPITRIPGLIAEDVESAGLYEFVERANDEIVNINNKLWINLIPITRQHHDDIEILKLENQYLKQKIKQLEEKVT